MGRLVALLVATAALGGGLFAVLHLYFSDVVAVASAEGPQSLWRFETAFVLTSLAWVSCFVAAIAGALVIHASWRRRRA